MTVLLDEGQDAFRPAAEKLATILNAAGRQARVVVFRPDEVRPLPLRWKPLPEDVDEMMFSGFLRKEPVELVRCGTCDIEVPAHAAHARVGERDVHAADVRRLGAGGVALADPVGRHLEHRAEIGRAHV